MARHSRHYRTAKKEVEQKPIPANGIFIRKEWKYYLLSAAVAFSLLVFLKGFLFGYIMGNRD